MREEIENYCKAKNITKLELAKQLEISRATLYRWSKKQPNAVKKLSKLINIGVKG